MIRSPSIRSMRPYDRRKRTVRDHETPEGRRHLGGLYYLDDRFVEAQQQWEIAFRLFRAGGQRPRRGPDGDRHRRRARQCLRSRRGGRRLDRAGTDAARTGRSVRGMGLPRARGNGLRPNRHRRTAGQRRTGVGRSRIEFNDADLEAEALADGGLAMVTQGRTTEGHGPARRVRWPRSRPARSHRWPPASVTARC